MTNTPTKLLRFGNGSLVYTFPETLASFQDNFGDLQSKISDLPGLGGGFDQYGVSMSPAVVGQISSTFALVSSSRGEMQALRDALRRTQFWGTKRLYIKPGDLPERFCAAKVKNISLPITGQADLIQPVQMEWVVSDPHWYEQGGESWSWGDGTFWGTSPWGGLAVDNVCTGVSTDIPVTVGGNAPTVVRIVADPNVNNASLKIQRIVNSVAVQEVFYNAALNVGQQLEINGRAMSVKLDGTNAYTSAFTYLTSDWITVDPGINTIRVILPAVGSNVRIRMYFYTTWR